MFLRNSSRITYYITAFFCYRWIIPLIFIGVLHFHKHAIFQFPITEVNRYSIWPFLKSLSILTKVIAFLFTHSTTPHHFICTRFHAAPFIHAFSPILSHYMLLSYKWFPQHALLTVVPHSMYKSLIHKSVLAENGLLTLSLTPWIQFFLS